MSVTARRVIYSLLSALGLALMVPFAIHTRRLDPASLQGWQAGEISDELTFLSTLFLLGLAVSSGFLYAALSAGVARAWKTDRVDGVPRCGRCGAEVGSGSVRCAACEQHLS